MRMVRFRVSGLGFGIKPDCYFGFYGFGSFTGSLCFWADLVGWIDLEWTLWDGPGFVGGPGPDTMG